MKGDSLRDLSRQLVTQGEERITPELIIAGSQQRIADAVEKLAVNYDQMKQRIESESASRKFYRERCLTLERKVAALKGVITKLKRKAAAS